MSRIDDSVNKARAREAARTGQAAQGTEVAEIEEGASFGSMEISPDEANRILKNEKWEMTPKVGALEAGKHYRLFVEGNGPDQEIKDKRTGEVKHVPTWIVSSPDGVYRVRLLGSYDLNQKLPDVVGEQIVIYRHPDRRLDSGNMFTEYDIAVQPRKDGQRRSFTRTSRALMLMNAIDVPALPAPSAPEAPATSNAPNAHANHAS